MYGTQAFSEADMTTLLFENDVKMYGTQASLNLHSYCCGFENDVKMYGTQAAKIVSIMALSV